MKSIVGNGGMVLAVLLAGSAFAAAASAQTNCGAYVRLTVAQAKANIAKKCGFKGPRWSLNVAGHKKWCEDVGPAEWRAELKKRDQMLAKCKG